MLQIKHLQALIYKVGYLIFGSVAISDEDDDLELLSREECPVASFLLRKMFINWSHNHGMGVHNGDLIMIITEVITAFDFANKFILV